MYNFFDNYNYRIEKYIPYLNDGFVKSRSVEIDDLIEKNHFIRQYVDFKRIVRVDTTWVKIFPVVAFVTLPLMTKPRNFSHYRSTILGYYRDRYTGETFFRLNHGHKSNSKAIGWFLVPPNLNKKYFRIRYYYWDKYVHLFKKTLVKNKLIVWSIGLDYRHHILNLTHVRFHKFFKFNAYDDVPVISESGNVLDSSFLVRNDGKKLVYLSAEILFKHLWFSYIMRKDWLYCLNVKNLNTYYLNSKFLNLNFLDIYKKFDWSIGLKYSILYCYFNLWRTIYFDFGSNSNFYFKSNINGLFDQVYNYPFKLLLKKKKTIIPFFFNNNLKKYDFKNFNYIKNFKRFYIKNFSCGFYYILYIAFKLKANKSLLVNILKKRNIKNKLRKKLYLIYIFSHNLSFNIKNKFRLFERFNSLFKFNVEKLAKSILNKLVGFNFYRVSNIIKKKTFSINLLRSTIKKLFLFIHSISKAKQLSYTNIKYQNLIFINKYFSNRAIKFKFVNLVKRIGNIVVFRKFFRKFPKKFPNKNLDKVFFRRKWRSKIKKYFKTKGEYNWGQLGDLYVFSDLKRKRRFSFIKYGMKSVRIDRWFSPLFISSFYKKIIYNVIFNLLFIIMYILRKCIFKLFFIKNEHYVADIEYLFYKLINLFYRSKFDFVPRYIKSSKDIILNKYYFRMSFSNKYFIN